MAADEDTIETTVMMRCIVLIENCNLCNASTTRTPKLDVGVERPGESHERVQ